MGLEIQINAGDGGMFRAIWHFQAKHRHRVLVLLASSNNEHIRSVTDGYAADGYVALAPDVYWRQEAGAYLPYTDDGRAKRTAPRTTRHQSVRG